MAKPATVRSEALTPGGPKRIAAQSRKGRGKYTRTGTLASADSGQMNTRMLTASNPQPIRQASMLRARDASLSMVGAAANNVMIAGASVKNATLSERNHARQ